jgi:hypothetical protein
MPAAQAQQNHVFTHSLSSPIHFLHPFTSSLIHFLHSFTSSLIHFFTHSLLHSFTFFTPTHRPRLSVHFSLFTVHCSLPTVHCSLPTVHCPLSTVHCPLFTVFQITFAQKLPATHSNHSGYPFLFFRVECDSNHSRPHLISPSSL